MGVAEWRLKINQPSLFQFVRKQKRKEITKRERGGSGGEEKGPGLTQAIDQSCWSQRRSRCFSEEAEDAEDACGLRHTKGQELLAPGGQPSPFLGNSGLGWDLPLEGCSPCPASPWGGRAPIPGASLLLSRGIPAPLAKPGSHFTAWLCPASWPFSSTLCPAHQGSRDFPGPPGNWDFALPRES